MPGKTKRKYVGETMRIHKKLKRPLHLISEALPYEYDDKLLLSMFAELYPYEWKEIVERCNYFIAKDKHLQSVGKKIRYKSPSPKTFFFTMPVVKNILSPNFKAKHKKRFAEDIYNANYDALKAKRSVKINQKNNKVQKYKQTMQEVEPYYIDALIVAYHQKGITTEGKMEIITEMSRFICDKSIKFFYKINDAERNNQIRNKAFQHLQNSGNYVKLRKNFKGKKKSYMVEKTDYNMTPLDLIKRLDADSIQNKKRFSAFISHSYADSKIVEEVISILNTQGHSCYCDWSSDNDFLKRSLVSDYTKEVLKRRIEQSDYLFFIRTDNSMTGEKVNSPWIEMELEYSKSIGKDIYYIDLIEDGIKLPYKLLSHNLMDGKIEWGE